MESKKNAKRIVSKVDYSKVQAGRAGTSLAAVFLILMGIFSLCSTIAFLFHALDDRVSSSRDLTALLLSGLCAVIFLTWGYVTKKEVESETVDIVPLTRANSQKLPVLDILVRASEKPVQDHEAVLLRAATEIRETSGDELLRPIETETNNMK